MMNVWKLHFGQLDGHTAGLWNWILFATSPKSSTCLVLATERIRSVNLHNIGIIIDRDGLHISYKWTDHRSIMLFPTFTLFPDSNPLPLKLSRVVVGYSALSPDCRGFPVSAYNNLTLKIGNSFAMAHANFKYLLPNLCRTSSKAKLLFWLIILWTSDYGWFEYATTCF